MNDLVLLCFFPQISKALNMNYFKNTITDIELKKNLINIGKIIIIEPHFISGKYLSLSPVWKHYLTINSSNTKLIIMGFCNFQSHNYIDLLNLPKDFDTYIELALPVSEEWEIPIDGANMLDYMIRFFEGHGGSSVMSGLNKLIQTFNTAQVLLDTGQSVFSEIQKDLLNPYGEPEWYELMQRWKYYYPFFEYLPFYPEIKDIDKNISEISEFFTCKNPTIDLFYTLNISQRLKKIHNQLSKIDRLYIRPEKYKKDL